MFPRRVPSRGRSRENNNVEIPAPMFWHLITAVRGWGEGFRGCHPAREAVLARAGDSREGWGGGCRLSARRGPGSARPCPRAPGKGLAPLQHSLTGQVVGHSCLQPSPANLEGLDSQWGRGCEGYTGCTVLGVMPTPHGPWLLPPWLLSLPCPTGRGDTAPRTAPGWLQDRGCPGLVGGRVSMPHVKPRVPLSSPVTSDLHSFMPSLSDRPIFQALVIAPSSSTHSAFGAPLSQK